MSKLLKRCLRCGVKFKKENLSNRGLCYYCAKERMLLWFDIVWSAKHKKEVKSEEAKTV